MRIRPDIENFDGDIEQANPPYSSICGGLKPGKTGI